MWKLLPILLLAVTATAQTTSNIDDLGLGTPGWQAPCYFPSCNPGGVGTPTLGSVHQTFVNASPSLDGNSMLMTEVGTNYSNVMYHYTFGANNSATAFTGSYAVYIQTSLAPWQVFGMDMYQYIPGVRLMFGSQCAVAGNTAGLWSFFNQQPAPDGVWNVSTVPCPLTAATWWNISMTVHRVPGDTSCPGGLPAEHYDSLTQYTVPFAPVTYTLNLSYCSETTTFANDTGMQFDVSGSATGGTNTAFVDQQNYQASVTTVAPASSCTPAGGTFGLPQTVPCTNAAPVQCYNFTGAPKTNGTTGCLAGAHYTAPITAGNSTLYIVGGGTGYTDGPVTPYGFTITGLAVPGGRINSVQAPDPAGTNFAAYSSVLAQKNPLLTGQTLLVGVGNSGASILYLDSESGTGVCTPNNTAGFTLLDGIIASYPTNVLLVPATEGGTNINTPACVFSQAQANAVALSWTSGMTMLPSWYLNISGTYWQMQAGCYGGSGYSNACQLGTVEPVACYGTAGPCTDGTAVMTKIGANAPLQDVSCSANYKCGPASANCYTANGSAPIVINSGAFAPCSSTEVIQGEPIPWELPIVNYYEQQIAAFISHYNGNVNMGYMRPGSPAGGELSPLGISATTPSNAVWPFSGSSSAQKRATFLSWVSVLDAYVMAQTPTFPIFTDLNNAGNPSDANYADQEALLAYQDCFQGLGTNGYQVKDVLALEGVNAGCNLTTGLVGGTTTCGSGDFPWLFLTYPKNSCGQHMYHSLQTLTGMTPLYCNAATGTCPGITGPPGPLPTGTNCTLGFPGLISFLGTLANVGIGALNQKIIVDNLELYVNAPSNNTNAGTGCAGTPAWPASDILLALYPNYSGTVGAQTQYLSAPAGCTAPAAGCVKPVLSYDAAFAQYLGIGTALGGTAPTGLTVFGSGSVPYGPPLYSVSTISTANPGTIAPIFIATAPTSTTCLGMCQNSVAYDTTLNPVGTDIISRVTDGTSFGSGASMGNLTFSGGDNDIMGSVNETYLGMNSGQVYIFHMRVALDGSYQVVNTGIPAIHVAGPFGFSKVTDTRFYYLVSDTQLWQGDITSDTTWTQTKLFDLTSGNGTQTQCPGINWTTFGTAGSASIMGISQTDQRFGWSVGHGGQGTADWAFVWDKTLGCSSINNATGQYWAFTTSGTSSTPASGTVVSTGCYGSNGSATPPKGIHDSQMSGDGNYMLFTLQNPPWTGGVCAGSTIANQQTEWQIGTSGSQWSYGANTIGVGGANLGSHNSVGVTNVVAPFNNGPPTNNGPNVRTMANVASFSGFQATGIIPTNVIIATDEHCSWPHPLNDDSYPWVCASDLTSSANGGSLTPNYMQNVIYAWFPNNPLPLGLSPRLFAHTFSCGTTPSTCAGGVGDFTFGSQQAIGYTTAKGNYFCWASTHLQSLGSDNLGHPRADGFCVRLQ
jgi:hypothetical protein